MTDITQKTCPYCHEDSEGFVTPMEKNNHAFIHFDMYGWHVHMQAKGWHADIPINFCPMFGRQLNVKTT
jgi:hypothetical protein